MFDNLGSFSCKKNTKRCWEECIANGGMTAHDCKALIQSERSVHEIHDLKVTIRKPRDDKTFQDSYWYIGIPTNLSGFTSCNVNDTIVRYPFDWTVSTPNGGSKVVSIPPVDCKGLRASQCCTKIMDTMAAEDIPTTDSNGHCLTCWVHSVPLEPVIHPSQGLMYKDYSYGNGVCKESLLTPAAVQNADKKSKDHLLQLGTYLENYAYNREAFMPMSEVSCENCTHTAIAAKKKRLYKGFYAQRDSGGVWATPVMSGQGLHHGYWNSKGMYEGENTAVI